ncbi:hypothetical protein GCM10022260_12580 [Gaetbulibacter aestuarii]
MASMGFAQKESANWYFGVFAGMQFKTNTPTPLLDGKLSTSEGCATISNSNGDLLFYTDGVQVWDRKHDLMPNGFGLFGHSSSTESAIIIPKPGTTTHYYIFTVDLPSYYLKDVPEIHGVNYSEVDLNLNNGFGDIVPGTKNTPLITYNPNNATEKEFKSTEKITAVAHSDGTSIWVITYFINKFLAFKVDYNGVNVNPVISTVPESVNPVINAEGVNISAIGYLKASPDGSKLAIAHSSTFAGSPRSGRKKSGKVLLYDFDDSSGGVTNQRILLTNAYPYGVEFSPNSKLLYITNNVFNESDDFVEGNLFQYDVTSSNVANSRKTISTTQNIAGALQLALNGKIYRAGYKVATVGTSLSVIDNPDIPGTACNYSENSVGLGGNNKYVRLGLPPFIQSIFLFTFDYEFTCLGDATHFYITTDDVYDTVLWDFGDGETSTLEEPYHEYTVPGNYQVSLTLFQNGVKRDPFIKSIFIQEAPQVLDTTYDLVQCDSYDGDPNDGIATFDLDQANEPISLGNGADVKVFYYHTQNDAVNDTLKVNGLGPIYKNQSPDEVLYAKVYGLTSDCYNLATVKLKTTQPVNVGVQELFSCDYDNDGVADFDLAAKAAEIKSQLNLSTNVEITFYKTASAAAVGRNNLPDIYASNTDDIYIRVESDNSCYGEGTLQLFVKSFPELADQDIQICKTEYPYTISSGMNPALRNDYSYIWNTGATTPEIMVEAPGAYEVLVYDPNVDCEQTVLVNVKEYELPLIQDLNIDGHSINVALGNTPTEVFLYALDDPNGEFQDSGLFTGIREGEHELFVKDANSCQMVSKSFYIFGFPKYFTPNNDGSNDVWNVYGLDRDKYDISVLYIKIFDRYGKLLKTFNPFLTAGWDGTFNGKLLTPDDYWYYMQLPNGEEYRGHFSLKI